MPDWSNFFSEKVNIISGRFRTYALKKTRDCLKWYCALAVPIIPVDAKLFFHKGIRSKWSGFIHKAVKITS